jgi:ribonuclease HI
MVLHLSHSKFYNLKLGVGAGSNTRAKLLALWGLLNFAKSIHVEHLQVVGDSKLIVDWINHICNLQVLNLESWQKRIRQLQEAFQELTITQVYREFNTRADLLSKEAVTLDPGTFIVKYFEDDTLVSKDKNFLFYVLSGICLSVFSASSKLVLD